MVGRIKKVLIVEDEKAMARALELKLKGAGWQTRVAGDGEEALDALLQESADLILLDLVMPKKDGFVVLEELKTRKNKIPIIVTSNLGQPEDLKRAKIFGVKEYFVKSDTSLSEIVAAVKRILDT